MKGTKQSPRRVLVTGASGLVGSAVMPALRAAGYECEEYDLRISTQQDVLNPASLERAIAACSGVVHLAAVSRVIWGEQDPARCRRVNVNGLSAVLTACLAAPQRPWVLFASSREVYGTCRTLPVVESNHLSPVNVYGRTKQAGEELVRDARTMGLRTANVRLSNVYGSADDHVDRVVPAFVRAALTGKPLRVEGKNHTFDFTFVADIARGLVAAADRLDAGAMDLPDVHLVSGRGTSLGELADQVLTLAGSSSRILDGPERDFDVANFVGDPTRASSTLGWKHETTLKAGLAKLIGDFRLKLGLANHVGGQK